MSHEADTCCCVECCIAREELSEVLSEAQMRPAPCPTFTVIPNTVEMLRNLTDAELLDMHIAITQVRHERAMAAAPEVSPNNWHKLEMNRQTLKDMGRNPNGSPKE